MFPSMETNNPHNGRKAIQPWECVRRTHLDSLSDPPRSDVGPQSWIALSSARGQAS